MSRIRGRGNKETEMLLAKLFRQHHISGWRREQSVFGKPDFVFHSSQLAVFVDGCFWHCCPKHSNVPVNNRPFWLKKLGSNKLRDAYVNRELRKQGWKVIRIWEHDLVEKPEGCLRRVQRALIE
jgi:DNA mismatch endonuclease (patch repair protein)